MSEKQSLKERALKVVATAIIAAPGATAINAISSQRAEAGYLLMEGPATCNTEKQIAVSDNNKSTVCVPKMTLLQTYGKQIATLNSKSNKIEFATDMNKCVNVESGKDVKFKTVAYRRDSHSKLLKNLPNNKKLTEVCFNNIGAGETSGIGGGIVSTELNSSSPIGKIVITNGRKK